MVAQAVKQFVTGQQEGTQYRLSFEREGKR
jgi:hypothetical protein